MQAAVKRDDVMASILHMLARGRWRGEPDACLREHAEQVLHHIANCPKCEWSKCEWSRDSHGREIGRCVAYVVCLVACACMMTQL